MADLPRIRRLVEGTLPAGAQGPPLTELEARQIVRRAWQRQWFAAQPLPPPLDRVGPELLAELRVPWRL